MHERGFRGVSLAEYAAALRAEPRHAERLVAITFDDGYADNLVHALPVLQEFGFTATVFAIVDSVGTAALHHAEWARGPIPASEYRFLNWQELAALRDSGIEIGAHTLTHPFLDSVPVEVRRREVTESRGRLMECLGCSAESFCCPAGRFGPETLSIVHEAGYLQAVVTPWRRGLVRSACWATLPRIGIYRHDTRARFQLKMSRLFPMLRQTRFILNELRPQRTAT